MAAIVVRDQKKASRIAKRALAQAQEQLDKGMDPETLCERIWHYYGFLADVTSDGTVKIHGIGEVRKSS